MSFATKCTRVHSQCATYGTGDSRKKFKPRQTRIAADRSKINIQHSSANLNTNPRTEQTAVTADAGLFHFYADFFDGIESFNDNFSSWAPWRQAAQLVQ